MLPCFSTENDDHDGNCQYDDVGVEHLRPPHAISFSRNTAQAHEAGWLKPARFAQQEIRTVTTRLSNRSTTGLFVFLPASIHLQPEFSTAAPDE